MSLAIRMLALGLFFLSLQKATAGFWLYQGQRALKAKDYADATAFFEKAARGERGNAGLTYLLGQSAWHLGREKKDPTSLKKAIHFFENLTQKLPYYGRGWIYLALARLAWEEGSEDGVTPSEWREIKPLFLEALQKEPGSAWMTYATGTSFLSQDSLLTPDEKRQALRLIKKSLHAHFPNPDSPFLDKPSPYLASALEFLWNRTSDPKLLVAVTPKNRASYQSLHDFLVEKGLWQEVSRIYPAYPDLQEKAYEAECERGEGFLQKGNFSQAFFAFRKAFWMRSWIYPRAKAGILIAEERTNQSFRGIHPLFKEEIHQTLQSILEEEDEDLGELLFQLKPVVTETQDPYLMGLHAVRTGDLARAKEWLEKSPKEAFLRRRLLALTYWQFGEREKARKTLKPALGEREPDLRELLLLASWDSISQVQVAEKIQQVATAHRPREAWWGKEFPHSRLDREGKMAMGVNLYPGRVLFRIAMRSEKKGADPYGFVLIKLNGRVIGWSYVKGEEWRKVPAKAMTRGGIHWLEVELVNGSYPKRGRSPQMGTVPISFPVVDLGPVEVIYPKR